jgi:hypothetical protein
MVKECPYCGRNHRSKKGANNCHREMRIACIVQCFPGFKNPEAHKEHQEFFNYFEELKG